MPAGSRIADAAVTADGRIHAWVIGAGDEPVRAYDPASHSWSLEAPAALPGPIPFEGELVDEWGYGDESEVAAGGDGLIYMTWGVAGPEFRLFAYDPATRRWERDAAVVFDEFVFDMASGTDGDIYLLTGSKVLRFDVDERRIEDAPEATAGFNSLAAAGNRVFAAFGGIGGTGDAAFYDAARLTWSAPEEQPGMEFGGWAADLDGWLYGVQIEPYSFLVVRDPAAGEWMAGAGPPAPLGSDVLVADGNLYVIGSGVQNAVFERKP